MLVWCEGSKAIGLGHVRRSLVVAAALERTFGLSPHVVCGDDVLAVTAASTAGWPVTPASHVDQVAKVLRRVRPRVVWVDVPASGARSDELARLRAAGHLLVAACDDNDEASMPADIAVLSSPGHTGREPATRGETHYLYGPRHFIMDPVYEATVPAGQRRRVVFISLGGTDQNDLLERVLSSLPPLPPGWSLEIVAGAGYRRSSVPRARLEATGVAYSWSEDVDDFPTRLSGCELAVTASGNTLFERMAAGVAGVALAQSRQQARHAELLAGLGATATAIDATGSLDGASLCRQLSDLLSDDGRRARMAERGREICDGGGTRRLLDAIAVRLPARKGD